ncbi:hypothetical protein LUZ63_020749 [Rhynchospora breviuscula]|uniref:Lon N-terminal domain-containing protein n=1 Tax=Rhynchospora breviuscula TaxID=2022672 RepID=A0A9P9Z7Y3_9POAL|nr:hypothetical protein LUZ63_020749 [Rhynchospora breviuscula]
MQLTEHEPEPDGTFQIESVGRQRFRLHRIDGTGEYAVGEVDLLEDPPGEDLSPSAIDQAERTLRTFETYRERLGELRGGVVLSGTFPTSPTFLSWSLSATCLLTGAEKQRLLETSDAESRLRLLRHQLTEEMRAMRAVPSLPATERPRNEGARRNHTTAHGLDELQTTGGHRLCAAHRGARRGSIARVARRASGGTPAVRALEAAGVAFTLHPYDHDPAAESYGGEAASALGVPEDHVLKTLLADVDGDLVVAVVPVSGQLDLKALAAAVGGKKAVMADPARAERSTGYVVGGISPLGQRKHLTTVVDESALAHAHAQVYVSGGRRGLDLALSPADLVRLLDARTAPIGRS